MKKLLFILLLTQTIFSQTEIAHWTASNSVVSGSNVTSVPDTSGNGYTLNAVGSPQYVASGINGLPSVQFTGTNYLELTSAMSQRTNLNELYVVTVFKETDANATNYHNILMVGATTHTAAGNNFVQLYNTNASGVFTANYYNNSLDATYTDTQLDAHYIILIKNATTSTMIFDGGVPVVKTSTQTVNANRMSIGGWNGKNSKMLWSETIVYQTEPTTTELAALNDYLQTTYNIQPFVEVSNEGINGNTSQDVVNRLTTINSHGYDLVTLSIGTNDVTSSNSADRISVSQFKTNVTTIVQSLAANGSQVILMPILPQVDSERSGVCSYYGLPSTCSATALTEPYNDAIYEVSQEQGVWFFNSTQYFLGNCLNNNTACSAFRTTANYGSPEGLHLVSSGADTWAKILYDYIVAININPVNIGWVGDSNTAGLGLTGWTTNTGQTPPARLKYYLNQ